MTINQSRPARSRGSFSGEMSSAALRPIIGRARTLTIWAARLLIAGCVVHMTTFLAGAHTSIGGWFTGELIALPRFGHLPETYGFFYSSVASFALPMFLLATIIHQFAVRGLALPSYVSWVLAVWSVFSALVYEPTGFPVLAICSGMLVYAAHRTNLPETTGGAR
ncbi:hypothetical protein [Nocardia sp. CDC160]|uniref:hypothetical protein n=1 Tax=Nocardia sp. CDC160 TaxID=3112166 RepID=UPI002DBEDCB6|nr:hypothetical protein [Nocardia sp. CDC160]MEC3918697.1 hypothetical protein [Nocardia sp. CDC160]